MNTPFCRAKDLLRQVPRVDFHIHSNYTDGMLSVQEVVAWASAQGLEAIALTDHARRTSDYVSDYLEQIETACVLYPEMQILKGLEVKILNLSGELDLPEAATSSLDLVVGVIHRFPNDRWEAHFASTDRIGPHEAIDLEREASLAMIERGQATVLGHPGRTFIEQYHLLFPDSAMRQLVEAATGQGVAVEVNARSPNLRQVLRHCLSSNCLVSLGSDAHALEEIGWITSVVSRALLA